MSDLENVHPTPGVERAVEYSEEHRSLVERAVERSLSESTRRSYASMLRELDRFALANGYEGRAPATIASFMAERVERGYSSASINTVLGAVKREALERGFPDPTTDTGLRLTVEGLRRQLAHEHQTRRVHAITVEELARVVSRIDDSPLGLRDRALLLFGWGSARRASSLSQLDRGDVEIRANGIRSVLRTSKTDQLGVERHSNVVARGHGQTDAVAAMRRYLAARGRVEGTSPLFVGLTRGGRYTDVRLSTRGVTRVVQERCTAAGLHIDVASHSLRAGMATAAAEAGVSVQRLAKHTGHKSIDLLVDVYYRPVSDWDEPVSGELGL